MIATARVIRKIHNADTHIIYIGPCIGQKFEAAEYADEKLIDAVIGFNELREMFKTANVTENAVEFSEFDPPHGFKGTLYPLCRGILQAGDISEDLENCRKVHKHYHQSVHQW